jgi:hypothetical protein
MKWLPLLFLCACGPSQAQLDEIRRLFEAREPALSQAEKAFVSAVPSRPAPRDGAGCKTVFHHADETQFVDRLVSVVALGNGGDGPLQASNVTFFTTKARLDSLSSGAVEARRSEQQKLLQRESPYDDLNGKRLVAAAQRLAADPLEPELLIEIGAAQDAKPIDKKTFQGGAMVGRVWLYSLSENRFVCAGNVVATSSKTVEVWQWKGSPRSDGRVEVGGDLYLNTVSEAQKSLKAL